MQPFPGALSYKLGHTNVKINYRTEDKLVKFFLSKKRLII